MSRNEETKEALERAIDGYGLARVVEMLADICEEKSDHVQTNWQDAVTARQWSRAAHVLYQACRAEMVIQISR